MNERFRFVVWAVLLVILISTFFHYWQKVQVVADRTAFTLATDRMLDRANQIKQLWILKGKPSQLTYLEQTLPMNQSGWVFPETGQGIDCEKILMILYPDERILNFKPLVESLSKNDRFICNFRYNQQHAIQVVWIGKQFSVKVLEEP